MNNAAINVHVQVLYGHMFSFLVGICLGIDLLGHVVTLCLTFEEQLNIFPKWSHFSFPPAVYEGSISQRSHQHLLWSFFLIIPILVSMKWSHCGFDLHFPES